jgi:hypothetical protein
MAEPVATSTVRLAVSEPEALLAIKVTVYDPSAA